jgi:hypothetical protein
VASSTLHWRLEGRPPRYRPVIRVEPSGSRSVTWAEFVEAGLLRSYRREHDVPLKELREFIDRLREEFQVPYPLYLGCLADWISLAEKTSSSFRPLTSDTRPLQAPVPDCLP